MKKIIKLVLIMMLVLVPVKSMGTETGHSKTVQITAKPGYQVTDVIVNGESKGPLTSYTFSDVLSPQSLEVITEAIGYTVTFNANGGEGTMEDQVFSTISGKLNKNIFTKEGYVFNGWSKTAGGEVEYEDEDVCFLLEDKTLYAVWGLWGDATSDGVVDVGDWMLVQQYISGVSSFLYNYINADLDCNGVINMNDSDIIAGMMKGDISVEELPAIDKKCIVIDGMYYLYEDGNSLALPTTFVNDDEEEENVGIWISDEYPNQTFLPGATVTVDKHAEFEPLPEGYGLYTVVFKANGGEGTMSPQAFDGKISQKLNANTFTREGYIFLGWALTSGGEVKYLDEEVMFLNMKRRNLYAVWGEEDAAESSDTSAVCKVVVDNSNINVKYNGTRLPEGVTEVPYGSILSLSASGKAQTVDNPITVHISYNKMSIWSKEGTSTTSNVSVSGSIVVCDDLYIAGSASGVSIFSASNNAFSNNKNGVPIYLVGTINSSYMTWTSNDMVNGQVLWCNDGVIDITFTAVKYSNISINTFISELGGNYTSSVYSGGGWQSAGASKTYRALASRGLLIVMEESNSQSQRMTIYRM